ncbi:hypothetical protein [Salmonirosea aquatica]|uniref:Uncharacterized protein n=1 Tax=Salmonirosea aquatica TaxID=2654236 RepID=A0A7C9FTM0_9BACT|nr:hypothetical protein [Cytophagaceae bacterium SJW1-29]
MKILLRILGGLVALLFLLFIGAYLLYNEPLPEGTSGPEADRLARKMMAAVHSGDLDNTDILTWTFNGSHHYLWDRKRNLVEVVWRENKVLLNLDEWEKGKAYDGGEEVTDRGTLDKKRGKAWEIFCNDSFWFIAPTKAFDEGVQRSVVKQEDGSDALLVTYTSGGVTPGDSYLWLMNANGLPYAFKLWVSIIPIGGIKATWSDWKTLKSGLKVATVHELGPVPLTITETASGTKFQELGRSGDPFAAVL